METSNQSTAETLPGYEVSTEGIDAVVQIAVDALREIDTLSDIFGKLMNSTSEAEKDNEIYKGNIQRNIHKDREKVDLIGSVLDQALPQEDGTSWAKTIRDKYREEKEKELDQQATE
jgi:hypothetical protein